MKASIKIITCISLIAGGLSLPAIATAQPMPSAKTTANTQNDHNKLMVLWHSYQKQLLEMERAITGLRTEADESQRNAKIAFYNRQLEEQKNTLNRLVLTQNQANILRQQMLEHATKYQNVFRLSTTPKPNPNQINMYERLNAQTNSLLSQMQTTALSIMQ